MISYDLGIPESSDDYKKIIEYIKALGTWAKPLKSQWFVVSSKDAGDIVDDLMSLTDKNDKLLVIDVSNDYWVAARLSDGAIKWMNENM